MSQSSANDGDKPFAVFYALGDKFIAARLEDGSVVHSKGVQVSFPERSIMTRSLEHCRRECCAIEPTREYRVAGFVVIKGADPLGLTVEQREWEEQQMAERNRELIFDGQTLAGYLRSDTIELRDRLAGAIIVDLEVEA